VLAALGPDGILINMPRGSVVDEAALIKALQDKTILSAGLDVYLREPDVPPGSSRWITLCCFPISARARSRPRADGPAVVDNLLAWAAASRR
jgi:lactate dehydrogenase-like 2-hydroxyacid dehydrogenase